VSGVCLVEGPGRALELAGASAGVGGKGCNSRGSGSRDGPAAADPETAPSFPVRKVKLEREKRNFCSPPPMESSASASEK
jgi:hypothetical protein